MTPIELFVLLISLLYTIFIFVLIIGFFSKRKAVIDFHAEPRGITVLISFKNERDHLKQLLDSLEKLDYPLFEVIFINDHSVDGSEEIISTHSTDKFSFRMIQLGSGIQGKKSALEEGVQLANYDLIATTDADCVLPVNWLESMARFSEVNSVVAGRVEILEEKGFWNRFQQLEMISIQAVSFGLGQLGVPISMSGANLCYPKKLFLQLQPYRSNKNIPSGDDIYFLQSLKRNHHKILFADSADNAVRTNGQTLLGYFNQRIRWMKKGSSLTDFFTILAGMMIFLSAFMFIFVTGYQLITGEWSTLLLISLGLKIIVDFLLLFLVTHHWKKSTLMIWFIPCFVLNVIILSVLPLIGWFIPVSWKGRKI